MAVPTLNYYKGPFLGQYLVNFHYTHTRKLF